MRPQDAIRRARTAARIGAGVVAHELGASPRRPPVARIALDRWTAQLRARPLPPVTRRVLVTALRNGTWMEWAAYAACVLRRMGVATTLLHSGAQERAVGGRTPARWRFWNGVAAIPDVRTVDLDAWTDASPGACPGLDAAVERIVRASVAYDRHVEEHDVADDAATYGEAVAALRTRMMRAGNGIHAFLSRERFDQVVVLSGLIGETPGLLHGALAAGAPVVCVEGWAWRAGHMIYNHGAPALEYNVQGWLDALGAWDERKEREVDAYLRFVDGARPQDAAWLESFYRVQRDAVGATLPEHVRAFTQRPGALLLAAPNVVGDSSMLVRERAFRGQRDWLEALVAHMRTRPQANLVVRAHPAEQWVGPGKCTVRAGELARRIAAGAPNVLVIGSEEPVNTFSLLPFARAGLVYLSSAGPEMVARGLPVVAAGRPKYEGLGIVEEPATRGAYFAAVDAHIAQATRPDAARSQAAKRYLHLVFKGFSFPAHGADFRAVSIDFANPPEKEAHDRFYRIVAGLERGPDQGPAGGEAR